MELVINANILFSIANPTSKTREIISTFPITFFSPLFSLDEIRKYKDEIKKKANIKDFESFINLLKERINFIDIKEYKDEIEKCKRLISDEKDVEYLALAKKLNLPIWSNDKLLKKQEIVKIINTKELIELL